MEIIKQLFEKSKRISDKMNRTFAARYRDEAPTTDNAKEQ